MFIFGKTNSTLNNTEVDETQCSYKKSKKQQNKNVRLSSNDASLRTNEGLRYSSNQNERITEAVKKFSILDCDPSQIHNGKTRESIMNLRPRDKSKDLAGDFHYQQPVISKQRRNIKVPSIKDSQIQKISNDTQTDLDIQYLNEIQQEIKIQNQSSKKRQIIAGQRIDENVSAQQLKNLYLNKHKKNQQLNIQMEAPKDVNYDNTDDLDQLLFIHNEEKLYKELQQNLSNDYENGQQYIGNNYKSLILLKQLKPNNKSIFSQKSNSKISETSLDNREKQNLFKYNQKPVKISFTNN